MKFTQVIITVSCISILVSCHEKNSTREVTIKDGYIGIAYNVDSCIWDSVTRYSPGIYRISNSVNIHLIPTTYQIYKSDTLTGILRDLKEVEVVCEVIYTIKEEVFFELITQYQGSKLDSLAQSRINTAIRTASSSFKSADFQSSDINSKYAVRVGSLLISDNEFADRFESNDVKLNDLRLKKKNTLIQFIPE